MKVQIHGRSVQVSDRFSEYVTSKTDKLSLLMAKALSFEVRVSRLSDKSPKHGDKVELTLAGPGPVIRAEATADDNFSAFDIAYGRLLERIRRHKDRRKADHRKGMVSLSGASASDFAGLDITPADPELFENLGAGAVDSALESVDEDMYTPVVIRHKSFPAERLSAEAAVDRMELVGHDFFLFLDETTGLPSVVYRRKGWNYGVISLSEDA